MSSRQRVELRWWERISVVLFGLMLTRIEVGPPWTSLVFGLVGLTIALSAMGLVELAMAYYYRARRPTRSG